MPATYTKANDVPSVEEVFGKYYGKDLFLAVNKAHTKVIATGATPQKAYKNAEKKGYKYPIIILAPENETFALIL